MRLEIGAGLVALGLVFYGPVLTALTLPRAGDEPPCVEVDEAAPVRAGSDRANELITSLQDAWRARIGVTYRDADVILTGGPGYVPREERVAVDRGYLDELATVYGVDAPVAQAYAIAHTMGHHVERQLAVTGDARALELEADCLAGVWARSSGAFTRSDARVAVAEATSIAANRRARVGGESLEPADLVSTDERVAALLDGLSSSDLSVCAQSGTAAGSTSSAPVNRARR